jgi:cell division protein ZipA
MHELRWTLLILGVLFIVVLAWWERRKRRQASGDRSELQGHGDYPADQRSVSWDLDEPVGSTRGGRESGGAPRVYREPTLTLPEVRTREPMPPQELPVVEITDDLRVDPDEPGLPVLEPVFPTPTGRDSKPRAADERDGADHTEEPAGPEARGEPSSAEQAFNEDVFGEEADDSSGVAASEAEPTPAEADSAAAEHGSALAEPIVEWPPDAQRKIIALRLVSPPTDRFPGRTVRQALAAEGFVLGKYAIFHKADEDRRAYLSAASLTKPGTFDLETMDSQRYGGLSLFAVLPGPKAPPETFDELLAAARNLNERLQGALQDEKGGPLTPTRIAAVRDSLTAEASS